MGPENSGYTESPSSLQRQPCQPDGERLERVGRASPEQTAKKAKCGPDSHQFPLHPRNQQICISDTCSVEPRCGILGETHLSNYK